MVVSVSVREVLSVRTDVYACVSFCLDMDGYVCFSMGAFVGANSCMCMPVCACAPVCMYL